MVFVLGLIVRLCSGAVVTLLRDILGTIREYNNFYVYKGVDISIIVMWHASNIAGCDRRTPELSNAPLNLDYNGYHIDI